MRFIGQLASESGPRARHSRDVAAQRMQQRRWPTLSTLRFRLVAFACLLSGASVFYTFHGAVSPHALEVQHQRLSFMASYRSSPALRDMKAAAAKLPVCTCSNPTHRQMGQHLKCFPCYDTGSKPVRMVNSAEVHFTDHACRFPAWRAVDRHGWNSNPSAWRRSPASQWSVLLVWRGQVRPNIQTVLTHVSHFSSCYTPLPISRDHAHSLSGCTRWRIGNMHI